MKKSITTIVIALFSLGAMAQQDAGFSMYFFNPMYVNPAYAGSREIFSGSLVHRSQWVKTDGSPTSQALSMHSAIPNSRIGLGLQAYNDQWGPMKNTGASLTFAYHLPVSPKAKLSFGLSGNVNNIRINWGGINIDDNNDPAFAGGTSSKWVPDAAAGLYLYKPRFYLGISATHLLQSKFGFADNDKAKFYRQFYLTSGVVVPLGTNLDLRPSILVKYVQAAPVLGEINATFILWKRLYLGAGYRMNKRVNITGIDNMLVAIGQFEITNGFRIGYSYDYFLNRTGNYNSGTHEFMLGWDINCTKTKMTSPRFF